ncbi:hypothetical protein CHARACLAT_029479 [Characodon lateralis]|uniref:Uncharacterized protein n=1 Tax=Characodon lateralis TaxID=208331 RepID=A0ABU7DKZ6_9TELE|nr:hypothetical protein [Characodon lateralis]
MQYKIYRQKVDFNFHSELKGKVSSSLLLNDLITAFHLVMHSYRSLRMFLCPVAGGHLCFVFAWGAFRVIGRGQGGPAARGMLGGGASRGRGAWGVRRLDVLLV